LAGLIVALIVAGLALNSVLNGAVFALWPVMRIVVNALLLYNSAVRSGRFDALRTWVITHLPNDRHVVPMVVGFCFGASLEGIAGLGTPVTITSSLLILVGFPTLEALVFGLIFNPAPVAFAVVTHLGTPLLRARVAARGAPDALHGTRTDADSFRQRYSGGTNLTFEIRRGFPAGLVVCESGRICTGPANRTQGLALASGSPQPADRCGRARCHDRQYPTRVVGCARSRLIT
jgi:hypothetical protein